MRAALSTGRSLVHSADAAAWQEPAWPAYRAPVRLSRPSRQRLDPVRRPGRLPRMLAVAALLVTAAGALYTGSTAAEPPSCAPSQTIRLLT